MAEANLTVEILKDIREDIRGLRSDQREQGQRLDAFARDTMGRFEVLEGTLKDLAEQMVMLGRGLKTALESRSAFDARFDEHERRLRDLEQRLSNP